MHQQCGQRTLGVAKSKKFGDQSFVGVRQSLNLISLVFTPQRPPTAQTPSTPIASRFRCPFARDSSPAAGVKYQKRLFIASKNIQGDQ